MNFELNQAIFKIHNPEFMISGYNKSIKTQSRLENG